MYQQLCGWFVGAASFPFGYSGQNWVNLFLIAQIEQPGFFFPDPRRFVDCYWFYSWPYWLDKG